MSNASKYDTDFYAWATEQAALLREGRLAEADIPNIAEELDTMGRSEKRELASRLTVLLTQLLKWQFQPGYRGNSWRPRIRDLRREVADRLNENPSLRPFLPEEAIVVAFRRAVGAAERETGFAETTFLPTCRWTRIRCSPTVSFPISELPPPAHAPRQAAPPPPHPPPGSPAKSPRVPPRSAAAARGPPARTA